jgi:hypothetical protein
VVGVYKKSKTSCRTRTQGKLHALRIQFCALCCQPTHPLSTACSVYAACLSQCVCTHAQVDNPLYDPAVKGSKKYMNIELHGLWGKGVKGPLEPQVLTTSGAATVSMAVLR